MSTSPASGSTVQHAARAVLQHYALPSISAPMRIEPAGLLAAGPRAVPGAGGQSRGRVLARASPLRTPFPKCPRDRGRQGELGPAGPGESVPRGPRHGLHPEHCHPRVTLGLGPACQRACGGRIARELAGAVAPRRTVRATELHVRARARCDSAHELGRGAGGRE